MNEYTIILFCPFVKGKQGRHSAIFSASYFVSLQVLGRAVFEVFWPGHGMMPMRAGKGGSYAAVPAGASPLCEQMAYVVWMREPMRERIVFI